MKKQIKPLRDGIYRFKSALRNIAAFNWPKPASVEISYENYPYPHEAWKLAEMACEALGEGKTPQDYRTELRKEPR